MVVMVRCVHSERNDDTEPYSDRRVKGRNGREKTVRKRSPVRSGRRCPTSVPGERLPPRASQGPVSSGTRRKAAGGAGGRCVARLEEEEEGKRRRRGWKKEEEDSAVVPQPPDRATQQRQRRHNSGAEQKVVAQERGGISHPCRCDSGLGPAPAPGLLLGPFLVAVPQCHLARGRGSRRGPSGGSVVLGCHHVRLWRTAGLAGAFLLLSSSAARKVVLMKGLLVPAPAV